jgi:cellulose synthase/poly-beta-1,6-N-acetylglucosamine synthase-like glycosyltransferase
LITFQVAVFLGYAVSVAVPFALLVPGYLVWLWWGRRHDPGRPAAAPAILPPVDVLVPVYQEAERIERKLENLSALTYPRDRVHFLVVDGASTDGTCERVAGRGARDARFALLRLDAADKTRQLNAGLERCRGAWVVVTDADAWLAPHTIERIVAAGEADSSIAVVGTTVVPECAHPLEWLHWRLSNAIRQRESDRGSASLVAGPCYAFRRTLLERFPDDVVSDDIHVALAAATTGKRVTLADVQVCEQRSPVVLGDLFRHKLRKTDGYLREIFRFLPRVGQMRSPARAIFLWRAAHLTLVPVLVALGALGIAVSCSHTDLPSGLRVAVPAVAAILFAVSWWGLGRRSSPVLLLAHGALLAAVTLVALLGYPFSRQTASLPKIAGGATLKRGGA